MTNTFYKVIEGEYKNRLAPKEFYFSTIEAARDFLNANLDNSKEIAVITPVAGRYYDPQCDCYNSFSEVPNEALVGPKKTLSFVSTYCLSVQEMYIIKECNFMA